MNKEVGFFTFFKENEFKEKLTEMGKLEEYVRISKFIEEYEKFGEMNTACDNLGNSFREYDNYMKLSEGQNRDIKIFTEFYNKYDNSFNKFREIVKDYIKSYDTYKEIEKFIDYGSSTKKYKKCQKTIDEFHNFLTTSINTMDKEYDKYVKLLEKYEENKKNFRDTFPFNSKFLNMSITLKDMLGDIPQNVQVPVSLDGRKGNIYINIIIDYINKKPEEEIAKFNKYHEEHSKEKHYHPEPTEFDKKFIKEYSKDVLFGVVQLASYLNIPHFYWTCCWSIAEGCKGKTPKELALYWNIPYTEPEVEKTESKTVDTKA